LIPFFPYQVDNNAEGDPFHPGNNVFPPDIKALNNTTNGVHTPAELKPGFHL